MEEEIFMCFIPVCMNKKVLLKYCNLEFWHALEIQY